MRAFVGQVERRGGGIALALGRDEGATAGAALDHAVAAGNLYMPGDGGDGKGDASRKRSLYWMMWELLKFPRLGRTLLASSGSTPNHSLTGCHSPSHGVVGMRRPRPMLRGELRVRSSG